MPIRRSQCGWHIFYLVDTLDIIDKDGNEVIDYYRPLADQIEFTFRSTLNYSSASGPALFIGSQLYDKIAGNVLSYEDLSYTAAQIMVHEYRHSGEHNNDPKHVACTHGENTNEKVAACDEYWCGEGTKLNAKHRSYCDKSKGGSGYNLGLRYLIDLYRYPHGHSVPREGLRNAIRYDLNNHMNQVSKSQRQHVERLLKR